MSDHVHMLLSISHKYSVELISKRLKSVTPAKADTQKRTENTGYRYGCAWRLGKQHSVSGFHRNDNNRLLKLARYFRLWVLSKAKVLLRLPGIFRGEQGIFLGQGIVRFNS
jgi:hypothetical protein